MSASTRPNARHGTELKVRKSITVDPEIVKTLLGYKFGGLSQVVDKALRVAVALLSEPDVDDYSLMRTDAEKYPLDGAVYALIDAAGKS